ncbi:MAG TPA: response regulator [Terriglobia bacterium]|nr:response regulator [Terriglobia bacterium]
MRSILVAEDNRTTRYLLRGVLKSAGFSVATAADGRAALDPPAPAEIRHATYRCLNAAHE